jgi:glycosyltransferase involved in cell wall biosynthesis
MPLFHPDLHYESSSSVRRRAVGDPLRLLFFGRILKYKGLPLLIDAVEKLRAEGVPVHLGVAGTGNIRHERSRLEALQAEVVNRWIGTTRSALC